MKSRWIICLLAILLLQTGCKDATWHIYTDHYLEDFVLDELEKFLAAHSEIPAPEIKVLSSEFIYQHIRHGQPIDIAFTLNAGYTKAATEKDFFQKSDVLGGDSLMVMEAIDLANARKMQAENCITMPPSDSPMRRLGDFWLDTWSRHPWECEVYPQDGKVNMHYAKAQWTKWYILPGRAAIQLENSLKPFRKGPLFSDLYRIGVPVTTRSPAWGEAFYEFCLEEKSTLSVVQIHSIP